MVRNTSASEKSGSLKSSAAKSSVPVATVGSRRVRRGTSDTLTPTERAIPVPSMQSATAQRHPIRTTDSGTAAELSDPSADGPSGGEVLIAVRKDLSTMPDELRGSGLAAIAVELARQLDNPLNSATSKSMCAGQLRDTLDRLRELMPAEEEADALDELASRPNLRIAGGATA